MQWDSGNEPKGRQGGFARDEILYEGVDELEDRGVQWKLADRPANRCRRSGLTLYKCIKLLLGGLLWPL